MTNIEKTEKEAETIKQEQSRIAEGLNKLGIDEADLLRRGREFVKGLEELTPRARMQLKQLKDALSKTSGKRRAEIVNKFKPEIDKLKKEADIISAKHNGQWIKDYKKCQKKDRLLEEKLRKVRERFVQFNTEIMGRN